MCAEQTIAEIYLELLELYGAQGWWPLNGRYHPAEYEWPKTQNQRFEICIGAILTQNTAWRSVEIALANLRSLEAVNPRKLFEMELEELKTAIRPSGYYNQKSAYLKTFTPFFLAQKDSAPTRKALLELRGVGAETADSMLLYAWHQPWFVVDAYTRRVFLHYGAIEAKESYASIQHKFHSALEPIYQNEQLIQVYQEYHALIVQHAKHFFSKKAGR